MSMTWDKDTDYMKLMTEMEQAGNLPQAAQYEQLRNQKIDYLNANNLNEYNAQKTNKYSQYLGGGGYIMPTGFTGSANGVYTFNGNQQNIQNQMNQNSQAWWDAYNSGNQSMMATLEAANKALAAQLGDGVTYDSHTGYWSGLADQPTSVQTGLAVQMPSFNMNDYMAANPMPTYTAPTDKPTYTSQYQGQIDALLNQILNREDFSYDAESDPLYQQYKKQYNREGTRAMNDTMAAAAINAGGMNTYAMTAAQQANDYYSAKLADKIPELYQLAYSMYMDDLNNQRADLSMLQGMDDTAYGRYRDDVGDWYTDRDFGYNQYRDQVSDWNNNRDFAYNQYRDEMGDYQWGTEFNYGMERDQIADQRYDQEWQYAVGRDQISDQRYASETAYERAMNMLLSGVMPNSQLLAEAGITSAEASALKAANTPIVNTGGGGSYSGGGSGGSGGTGGNGGGGYKDDDDNGGNKQKYYTVGQPAVVADDIDPYWNGSKTNELDIDWDSVNKLNMGPIGEEQLAQLEAEGKIVIYEEGNKIKVKKADGATKNKYPSALLAGFPTFNLK